MAKVLIIYYSRSGNTRKMAELIAEGIKKENVELKLQKVRDTEVDDLFKFDCLVMGSPCYYGTMASELKELLDKSVKFHGRLEGKVGAAFSSSANLGGGNETTVLDILNALLIHGMIVQGDPLGSHYGAVSLNLPEGKTEKQCIRMGQRVAKLVKRLFS